MALRLLLVDDEPPARARLRRLLAVHADVEVIGEAGDAAEALALATAAAPDAVLLDIRMPGTDGLDLAASLPDPRPAVIFVTAHGEHALAAFDVAALDYLLKPVEPARLAQALERLRRREPATPRPVPERLLIPDRGRLHVVPVPDILWLEAADNYVVVHTAGASPLLRRTLAGLLQDLGPGFVQTHRSAAVALAHVRALRPADGGEAQLLLSDGRTVRCSRTRRAAVLQHLQPR